MGIGIFKGIFLKIKKLKKKFTPNNVAINGAEVSYLKWL